MKDIQMKICQTCSSSELYHFNAHSKDLGSISAINGTYEHDGYFPHVENICSGDDLDITVCLNCGQTQGTFPVKINEDRNMDPDTKSLIEELEREEQKLELEERVAKKEREELKRRNVFVLKKKHFKSEISDTETSLINLLDPVFVKFLEENCIEYKLDQNVGAYGSIIISDDDFYKVLSY